MKTLALAVVLAALPFKVEAQVWEYDTSDSIFNMVMSGDAITADIIGIDTVCLDLGWVTGSTDATTLKPGVEYRIEYTDSGTVRLIDATCWKKWLDTDSVSHCGHKVNKLPKVDSIYAGVGGNDSAFGPRMIVPLRATEAIYWCETCGTVFALRREIEPTRAK